jgi:hypothetical protein
MRSRILPRLIRRPALRGPLDFQPVVSRSPRVRMFDPLQRMIILEATKRGVDKMELTAFLSAL